MQYRRSDTKGGTYFLTINLADRTSNLLVHKIEQLRAALRKTKNAYPFKIIAMVVMPDHMHILMELPDGDSDYPLRVRLIKTHFSKSLPQTEAINSTRLSKGERGIWQRRYWEHQIRDEQDLNNHIDYIHINPVKHGYVGNPFDWGFSTIHKYVRLKILPKDWGGEIVCFQEQQQEFGE